jgi:hypothetical protein
LSSSTGQLIGGALVGAIADSQVGGVPGYQSAYFVIGLIGVALVGLALGLKSYAQERATMHANHPVSEAGAEQAAT